MCGVLLHVAAVDRSGEGSSPHMRGFVSAIAPRSSTPGFIPACAGFCREPHFGQASLEVHPRMCGVLEWNWRTKPILLGSSPHVRGFEAEYVAAFGHDGFIPACAGFWSNKTTPRGGAEVHPRMCGVLTQNPVGAPFGQGSSPHVRGFVLESVSVPHSLRFIPACAGFCAPRSVRPFRLRVHPRMCGVLVQNELVVAREQGSSPHVRGFDVTISLTVGCLRFIPACAGFCEAVRRSAVRPWVHPRMCGVLASHHA